MVDCNKTEECFPLPKRRSTEQREHIMNKKLLVTRKKTACLAGILILLLSACTACGLFQKGTLLPTKAPRVSSETDTTSASESTEKSAGTTEGLTYKEIGYVSEPLEDAMVEIAPGEKLVTNELILVFQENASRSEIEQLVSSYEGRIVGENELIGDYQVRFSGTGKDYIFDLMEKFRREPLVEEVFLNSSYQVESSLYPNDTLYDKWNESKPDGNNWGLEAINAPGAWEYVKQLQTVRVGVIDSFIQYDHPDLDIPLERTHVLATDDFQSMKDIKEYYDRYNKTHVCEKDPVTGRCTFCSVRDHGTHCSGIIAAKGNNKRGVAGVAWNAELFFSTAWYLHAAPNGQMKYSFDLTAMIHNISWLVANGCRVINISIGDVNPSVPGDSVEISETARFNSAMRRLHEKGYDFLIFKSAGNESDDASRYMLNRIMTGGEYAKAHTVIVANAENYRMPTRVIASWFSDIDRIYELSLTSNYGEIIDIAAPGTEILSTVYGEKYAMMSGTSMAAPMAAGVAGLLYGANPDLTCQTVKSLLRTKVTSYAEKYRTYQFHAFINAQKAVEWVIQNKALIVEREQPSFGSIAGHILDADTHEPIEIASFQIINDITGTAYYDLDASFSSDGYLFFMDPGSYSITVSAPGFDSKTIPSIQISRGHQNVDFILSKHDESKEKVKAFFEDIMSLTSVPATILINRDTDDYLHNLYRLLAINDLNQALHQKDPEKYPHDSIWVSLNYHQLSAEDKARAEKAPSVLEWIEWPASCYLRDVTAILDLLFGKDGITIEEYLGKDTFVTSDGYLLTPSYGTDNIPGGFIGYRVFDVQSVGEGVLQAVLGIIQVDTEYKMVDEWPEPVLGTYRIYDMVSRTLLDSGEDPSLKEYDLYRALAAKYPIDKSQLETITITLFRDDTGIHFR